MGGNVRHAYKGTDREIVPDARDSREEAADDDRYGQRGEELHCPYCGVLGCEELDQYCSNCGAKLTATFKHD